MIGVTTTALVVLMASSSSAVELEGCRPMGETLRLLGPLLEKPWSQVSRDEIVAAWPKPLTLEDCEPRGNECGSFATCHCDRLRHAGRTIAGDVLCSDLFMFSVAVRENAPAAERLETVVLVVSAGTRKQLESDVAAFRSAMGEADIRIEPQGKVWSAWIHWTRAAPAVAGAPAKASQSTGAAPQPGPEALVDSFVRAWNAHDMQAFGNLFTDDADFVNVAGRWWKGRAEIQARHEESHARGFRTSTLVSLGTSVRLLRPDMAVMHFSWELTGQVDPDGKQMPTRRGIIQMLAVKQSDAWRIAAAQNTNAREAAQP